MDAELAVKALRKLKMQAETEPLVQAATPNHKAWKAKVQGVLDRSLGHDSSTATQFRTLSYSIGFWTGAPGEAEQDARHFAATVREAVGLIDAAIFELELSLKSDSESSAGSFDPGLWDHVRHNVEKEQWAQVAAAAVIYTEDKVRRWAQNPTDKSGRKLTGKDLFLNALAPEGPIPLGEQTNERDGWRMLGSGLVAALGNVDRHNIQERDDLRRYAMGVVGLASLLLTQIKHQYPSLTIQSS